jgi:chemotaxis protein MotB
MNKPDEQHGEIIIIRRGHDDHDDHHGGVWKIAFADFMTAMMAFFLVMWLINASNEETKKAVASYFNPVKLMDTTTNPKGVKNPKYGKESDPETEEDENSTAVSSTKQQVSQALHAEGSFDEQALFSDPYSLLSQIAGGITIDRKLPSVSLEEGGEGGGGKSLAGGEQFQDPFDPSAWNMQFGRSENLREVEPGEQVAQTGLPGRVSASAAEDNPAEDSVQAAHPTMPQDAAGARGELAKGDMRSGQEPQGEVKSGPAPAGTQHAGTQAEGARQSGTRASGEQSSGDKREGERNAGTRLAGVRNSGAEASGERDSGTQSAGKQNSGEQEEGTKNLGTGAQSVAEDVEMAQARDLADSLRSQLQGQDGNAGFKIEVETRADGQGALITLADESNSAMFNLGSARPTPELVRVMEKIGAALAEKVGKVTIAGHTDAHPYNGEDYDNWRLSTARAHMAYYMLVRGGLPEPRVERIEGHAAQQPKLREDPYAPVNRRIEIFLRTG